MPVRSYSPKDVFVIRGGRPMGGFADGTFVEIELPQTWSSQIGAGGAHTRTLNADRSGKVTVRLQQTSIDNDTLAASWQADKRTGQGSEPIIVKDGFGRSLFFALQSWVEQAPGPSRGAEAGTMEWVLQCADVDVYQGGST